jgi:hypothetical protein
MMYVDVEKGWVPERFRGGAVVTNPMTKIENAIHLLSRVKWMNLAITLFILMGFGYGIISMAKDVAKSLPAWQEESHQRHLKEELSKYEQVEVVIQEGDTAWTIQEKLTPNANDLRDPLYLAEEINGEVDWGNLLPGQTLKFLKEKKNK